MRLLHHLIARGLQNLSRYDMCCDEGICFVSIFIAQPVPPSSILPEVQERGEMQVHYCFHSLNWIDAFPVLFSKILGVFLVVENRCGDRYSIISCRKVGAKSLRTNHSMFWSLSTCGLQLFAYLAVVVVVQSLSHVWFFASSWTAAHQASLSFTITWSLRKPMSLESVMPSSHLILCLPLLLQSFPASESFPMSQLLTSGGQRIGASASASVLPMNIQGWLPLGLTDLISLLSKGLSRVFSNSTVQKHQFFDAQPFLWSISHIHTWLLEKP